MLDVLGSSRSASRLAVLGMLALGLLAATGCGEHARPAASADVLRVTEKDFTIKAPRHARAGDIRILAQNEGPDDHELIVVRARSDRPLPLRRDGITVDEDAIERATAGSLEPALGAHELRVHLTPGRYVLFCNMAGHYLGGMHVVLEVG